MYPWTQAVIAYQMTPTNVSLADLSAAAAIVPLVFGEKDLIGFTVASDVTAIVGPNVIRTLTLALTAQFNSNIQPTADPSVFFQNLYTITLSRALVVPVVTLPPIVT